MNPIGHDGADTAPLTVLHEAGDWLAVHKPAGLLVHRSPLDAANTDTVQRRLKAQLGAWLLPVHRLDRGTSGVLLLARTPAAARAAQAPFLEGRVRKHYLGLVRGWPAGPVAVDHPLRPEDAGPEAPAQPAWTAFAPLARLAVDGGADPRHPQSRYALVAAWPRSGRRHQIRRHLKHLAHPLVGDATHGKGEHNRWWAAALGRPRLWLHAQALGLPHPDGGWLHLASPLHAPWNADWQALAAWPGWQTPWPEAAWGATPPELPAGLDERGGPGGPGGPDGPGGSDGPDAVSRLMGRDGRASPSPPAPHARAGRAPPRP
ncbi:pseudouridine synthase [Piscinibacter sp. Jin2]|uniref:tRNA pseudouridine synthase C n=1 Tax=Aquariibacter lacus TaxID=2801332 RepID=A0A9X1BNC8_9BURK|nr:pseudouridine synthase [Piscinibacter lacus]MBL0719670.1 pseudouridine synthase [Piscinibacter lacus]